MEPKPRSRKRTIAITSTLAVLGALLAVVGTDVEAQTPGTNGDIYFISGTTVNRAAPGSTDAFTTSGNTTGASSVDGCHTNPDMIVYDQGDGIYEQTFPGGVEMKLGDTVTDDADPVYSPDCSSVAFTRPGSGIWRWDRATDTAEGPLDGTTAADALLGATGLGPEISPDGSRVYFDATHDPGTGREIFYAPFPGTVGGAGTATDATDGGQSCGSEGVDCHSPSISPDGSTLAFKRSSIATAPVEGAVSDHPDAGFGGDVSPDWSPDGTQIVLASGATGNADGLARVNFPANGFRNEFDPNTGSGDARPDWVKASGAVPTPTATATATPTGSPQQPFPPTPSPTQPNTGMITGTVTQGGGTGGFFNLFALFFGGFGGGGAAQPVVGATVETDTDESATTDEDGDYKLNNVPVGTRTVNATTPNGQACTPQDAKVTVEEGETADQDFTCGAAGGFNFLSLLFPDFGLGGLLGGFGNVFALLG